MRKKRKIITGLAILLTVSLLISIFKPANLKQFKDEKGRVLVNSISEKRKVIINGIEQGMIIRGKDINNPVILFVHGGPGMPEYFLAEKYNESLEENFTVCYWDQRGGGLSYSKNINYDDITVEQLISDTKEVSKYLKKEFNKDKIYLMAHSWGSFIGIQVAHEAPWLYYAYIGISQIVNTKESDKLAYEYAKEEYQKTGNKKRLKELKRLVTVSNGEYCFNDKNSGEIRDAILHELGVGTTHEMKSVVTGIFLPVMSCDAYTLQEKINIWKGKVSLGKKTKLNEILMTTDLSDKITSMEIPIYFLSGKYDYTVNVNLTKKYFDVINAPKKEFYLFENSAHSPIFEETEKFLDIMIENIANSE